MPILGGESAHFLPISSLLAEQSGQAEGAKERSHTPQNQSATELWFPTPHGIPVCWAGSPGCQGMLEVFHPRSQYAQFRFLLWECQVTLHKMSCSICNYILERWELINIHDFVNLAARERWGRDQSASDGMQRSAGLPQPAQQLTSIGLVLRKPTLSTGPTCTVGLCIP